MRKKSIQYILSFLITAGLVFILLRNVSVTSLRNIISSIPPKFIVLAFLAHLSAYIIRSLIFFCFLKQTKNLRFIHLLNVHMIHNFYAQTIPASLGELCKNRKINFCFVYNEIVFSHCYYSFIYNNAVF